MSRCHECKHPPKVAGLVIIGIERPGTASRVLVRLFRPGHRWKGNELRYQSHNCDFAGRHLQVEIIATGGNMHLGDIKNVTSIEA